MTAGALLRARAAEVATSAIHHLAYAVGASAGVALAARAVCR